MIVEGVHCFELCSADTETKLHCCRASAVIPDRHSIVSAAAYKLIERGKCWKNIICLYMCPVSRMLDLICIMLDATLHGG